MFIVGQKYSRAADIHDQYGGTRQSGISSSASHPFIFLFTGDSGEAYGYEDGWQADDGVFLYTGQGQIGDMEFVRGNKAIRDHISDGKQLLLFRATGKGKPVEFIGEFECASIDFASGPDLNGGTRKTIRFNLTPLNSRHSADVEEVESGMVLPARTFEQMRQSAFDAVTPTETPNWRMAKQIRRQRSSEIKEYVLRRANGVCELTAEKAPFNKANGQPYLEVHHIKKLSDGGLDHPVNCAAITPNAHREIHFGANGKLLDERLASLIGSKEQQLSET
ncbi:HNH endonuclease [Yoonia sp.]|uniref:HNH endonuclease n=1 Tax=Yoonia sp. TaxID=2212373 RepID=UPI003F6F0331